MSKIFLHLFFFISIEIAKKNEWKQKKTFFFLDFLEDAFNGVGLQQRRFPTNLHPDREEDVELMRTNKKWKDRSINSIKRQRRRNPPPQPPTLYPFAAIFGICVDLWRFIKSYKGPIILVNKNTHKKNEIRAKVTPWQVATSRPTPNDET